MVRLLGKGVWALMLRIAIGAATSVVGFAGFSALGPAAKPPAPEVQVDTGRSTRLLLTIDLATLAAKDYLSSGDPAVAREFDQGLRRIEQLIGQLEKADEPGRAAARAAEPEILRIESVVRGVRDTGPGRIAQISEARDRIASAMAELHAVDVQRLEPKDDATTALAYKLGGAGLATLGLCFAGGIGLARLCVA